MLCILANLDPSAYASDCAEELWCRDCILACVTADPRIVLTISLFYIYKCYFPSQAEYSYYSVAFIPKIFLNYSLLKTYRAFSLTWPVSMLIYWNKRKFLHKKRVQLPQDCLGTPTWPPFYCFGTPIWPPWRHVKTIYSLWHFYFRFVLGFNYLCSVFRSVSSAV